MNLRRACAAAAVAVAATALTACAEESEPNTEVTVAGEAGEAPELTYEVPLEVEEPMTEVIWAGDGPELVDGRPVLLHYYAEAGNDASLVGETFDAEPKPFLMTKESLGPDIYSALAGQRVGSRVLQVVPQGDGQPFPTVAVFDILPSQAIGEPVEPREGLPQVTLDENGAPTISVPEGEPPTDLLIQPLIKGDGEQVQPGQVITVQYTGVRWSDGEVFESSWTQGQLPLPFPIGVGSVMQGWDQGLVEQTVGSQVLLVVPPGLGYAGTDTDLAEETLVFVVDILAASGGPQQD